ncbi:enhanced ethylene response protein 5 isoform X2 [Rosa chinensis]|uniref:enhanced ethylene response protein 5 isoform X2 n=1 Tax=Rosa chinensis TaxID=74649 RepID=UPI000D0926B2|nr:enhanced ethylene response protein 5 isoform X2 [Rosa chinensis]
MVDITRPLSGQCFSIIEDIKRALEEQCGATLDIPGFNTPFKFTKYSHAYMLVYYGNVVQALRRGDLRLLRYAFQEHEDRFFRFAVYLVLEKLELQVYQRLLKKDLYYPKAEGPKQSSPAEVGSNCQSIEMVIDVDEVEGIMAMLIHKSLVKGYFAHKSRVVVLSKH